MTIFSPSCNLASGWQTHDQQQEPSEHPQEKREVKELNLHSLTNLNEQMLVISSLAEKNIRPYMDEIKEFLQARIRASFFKNNAP